MKTDISIPNPVFRAAENLARKMGVSLSDLYTAALNAYVAEHLKENVTDTLDQVYANEESTLVPELLRMQVVSLEGEEAALAEDWMRPEEDEAWSYLKQKN